MTTAVAYSTGFHQDKGIIGDEILTYHMFAYFARIFLSSSVLLPWVT